MARAAGTALIPLLLASAPSGLNSPRPSRFGKPHREQPCLPICKGGLPAPVPDTDRAGPGHWVLGPGPSALWQGSVWGSSPQHVNVKHSGQSLCRHVSQLSEQSRQHSRGLMTWEDQTLPAERLPGSCPQGQRGEDRPPMVLPGCQSPGPTRTSRTVGPVGGLLSLPTVGAKCGLWLGRDRQGVDLPLPVTPLRALRPGDSPRRKGEQSWEGGPRPAKERGC